MRAVRVVDGHVAVVEVPRPVEGGVRVRIRSSGICGSDLHMIESRFPLAVTLGHEMAGELDDGSVVAIEPIVNCRACSYCDDGAYNLCRAGPAAFIGVGLDGGMADEIRVPEHCLVPLPEGVPVADACLVEPLAVAVHGLRRARVSSGHGLCVVGGGTIGLCAVAVARALGAEVALEARHDAQRRAGERLGVGAPRREYDIVVDCAGSESALESAVRLCKPGGTLILLATYWNGLDLPGIMLCMKEIRILPSSMYSRQEGARDFDMAARMLADDPAIAPALISHRYSLDAAPEAFAMAANRADGAIKVVLET